MQPLPQPGGGASLLCWRTQRGGICIPGVHPTGTALFLAPRGHWRRKPQSYLTELTYQLRKGGIYAYHVSEKTRLRLCALYIHFKVWQAFREELDVCEPRVIRKDLPQALEEWIELNVRGKQLCRGKAWKKCTMCPGSGLPSPCKKPQATLEGAHSAECPSQITGVTLDLSICSWLLH